MTVHLATGFNSSLPFMDCVAFFVLMAKVTFGKSVDRETRNQSPGYGVAMPSVCDRQHNYQFVEQRVALLLRAEDSQETRLNINRRPLSRAMEEKTKNHARFFATGFESIFFAIRLLQLLTITGRRNSALRDATQTFEFFSNQTGIISPRGNYYVRLFDD
jgi:hypothetical protein